MRFCMVVSCLVSGFLVFSVSTGWAGGRIAGKRANLYHTSCHGGFMNGTINCQVPDRPYVCQGGSSDGQACDPKQHDCGEGKCVLNKNSGDICFSDTDKVPGQCMIDLEDRKPIKGILTVMVDNTATNWRTFEEGNNAPAPQDGTLTTVLLEVRNKGETILFTDSYIQCCVSESQAAGWAQLVDEASLEGLKDPQSGNPQSSLRGFPLQNANSLQDAILEKFGGPGIPIITKTTNDPDKVIVTSFPEQDIGPVGAAARLNVEIHFAKPK